MRYCVRRIITGSVAKAFVIIAMVFGSVYISDVALAACSWNDPDDGCQCGQENTNNPGEPIWCTDCGMYTDCNVPEDNCDPGEYLATNGACTACPDKYPNSPGGNIGINKCFVTKQCGSALCQLYYNGTQHCDIAYLEYDNAGTLRCKSGPKDCHDFNFTNNFDANVTNPVSMTWQKTNQMGQATWYAGSGGWNVENCRLQKDNVSITGSKNCNGTIWRSWAEAVWNADAGHYDINYTGDDRYYCTQCVEGKMPTIVSAPDGQAGYGCVWNESGGGSYVACACSDVELGFYSDGCDINYPLDSQTVPNACHKQCPTGMTTLNPGASGVNDCVPDGSGLYSDLTGWFRLGSTRCE